jgi:hypothetical protein
MSYRKITMSNEKHDDLNLSDDVVKLAGKLKKELVVTPDGTITPEKGLIEKLLPEGLTMDEVKKVQAFNSTLVAAASHAVGEIGTAFLKKHDKVAHVHLEKLPFGRDHVRVNLARTQNVPGLGGKSTEHHGYLSTKFVSGSAGTSGAQFKRIRDHHSKVGAELFGGK